MMIFTVCATLACIYAFGIKALFILIIDIIFSIYRCIEIGFKNGDKINIVLDGIFGKRDCTEIIEHMNRISGERISNDKKHSQNVIIKNILSILAATGFVLGFGIYTALTEPGSNIKIDNKYKEENTKKLYEEINNIQTSSKKEDTLATKEEDSKKETSKQEETKQEQVKEEENKKPEEKIQEEPVEEKELSAEEAKALIQKEDSEYLKSVNGVLTLIDDYDTSGILASWGINIKDEKIEMASVIIDPNTGKVLALSGGRNYKKSEYNRALSAKRQVGSTMKPILYYGALENGMTSSSTFLSQYTTFNLSDGKTYAPKNYGNLYGNKEITMAAALAYSDNIYAVKTNLFLGVDTLINTAKKCGIKEKLKNVVSLALGTSELNMLDFANAYTTFASLGYKKDLYFIEKILDKEGNVIYSHEPTNNLVLNPNYVYILNELLTSTTNSSFIDYNYPTALNIAEKLNQKYAFKTGTTDTDYWAVGYNKNILMMTWAGYDDNSNIELKLGGEVKNVWANTISYIQKDSKNNWYEMPENVVGLPLNAINGQTTNDKKNMAIFYYLKGSEPYYIDTKKDS